MSKERKPKRPPPPHVQFAILMGDREALSRAGRAGAMRKKELAELDRLAEEKKRAEQKKEEARETRRAEQRREWWANSSKQTAREANEHICPID